MRVNEYDGFHRRIGRTESGVTPHIYYNETWQYIEERLGSLITVSKRYVWHPKYMRAGRRR